jgi:hypothetical protein
MPLSRRGRALFQSEAGKLGAASQQQPKRERKEEKRSEEPKPPTPFFFEAADVIIRTMAGREGEVRRRERGPLRVVAGVVDADGSVISSLGASFAVQKTLPGNYVVVFPPGVFAGPPSVVASSHVGHDLDSQLRVEEFRKEHDVFSDYWDFPDTSGERRRQILHLVQGVLSTLPNAKVVATGPLFPRAKAGEQGVKFATGDDDGTPADGRFSFHACGFAPSLGAVEGDAVPLAGDVDVLGGVVEKNRTILTQVGAWNVERLGAPTGFFEVVFDTPFQEPPAVVGTVHGRNSGWPDMRDDEWSYNGHSTQDNVRIVDVSCTRVAFLVGDLDGSPTDFRLTFHVVGRRRPGDFARTDLSGFVAGTFGEDGQVLITASESEDPTVKRVGNGNYEVVFNVPFDDPPAVVATSHSRGEFPTNEVDWDFSGAPTTNNSKIVATDCTKVKLAAGTRDGEPWDWIVGWHALGNCESHLVKAVRKTG